MVVKKYLGEDVTSVDSLSGIREGNFYIVERGIRTFRAFRAPYDVNEKGVVCFRYLKVYEAHLDVTGEKIEEERVIEEDLCLDNFVDIRISHVFEVNGGNGLHKMLEEKLGSTNLPSDLAQPAETPAQ